MFEARIFSLVLVSQPQSSATEQNASLVLEFIHSRQGMDEQRKPGKGEGI
jgi:hypothetical protein